MYGNTWFMAKLNNKNDPNRSLSSIFILFKGVLWFSIDTLIITIKDVIGDFLMDHPVYFYILKYTHFSAK